MELVTGFTGEPHVTSEDDRDFNAGVFGSGTFILGVGQKMRPELATNNLLKIYDGSMIMQGAHVRIRTNLTEEAVIENGTQNEKRIDLVVFRYEKVQDTGVESVMVKTVKGTPHESNPQEPVPMSGNLRAGDLVHEEPVFRVTLDGISVVSVDQLVEEVEDMSTLKNNLSKLDSDLLNILKYTEDTGWKKANLTSDFTEYSDNGLLYRKIGKLVQVTGSVKPTKAIAGSSDKVNIFTLPEGYRPTTQEVCINHAGGSGFCTYVIETSGLFQFRGYRDGSGYLNTTTGTWLPINVLFFVDN